MLSVWRRIWHGLQPLKQCKGHQARMHSCSQPSGKITDITFLHLEEQLCVLTFQFPQVLILEHKDLCASYKTWSELSLRSRWTSTRWIPADERVPRFTFLSALALSFMVPQNPLLFPLISLSFYFQNKLHNCHQKPRVVNKSEVEPPTIYNCTPHQSTPPSSMPR